MNGDQELIQLIQNNPFLNPGDKQYLFNIFNGIAPLDKMRLRASLVSNQPEGVLQVLQYIKAKFLNQSSQPNTGLDPQTQTTQTQAQTFTSKTNSSDTNQLPVQNQQNTSQNQLSQSPEEKKGFLEKVVSAITPEKKPVIVAESILTSSSYLGSQPPRAIQSPNLPPLQRIDQIVHPSQLSLVDNEHVNFSMDSSSEQIIRSFMSRTEEIFSRIDSVDLRRGFFMNFVQSNLLRNYILTGLTALKRQDLQPRKVVFNLLHQIDPNYLNTRQYQITADITNHLKNLAGL